jgi:large subunit ribosomal protein L13
MILAGEQVEIVNAGKAVMLGTLESAKAKFLSRRSQKNKRNPDESPHYPRVPNMLLRRLIRGMLPWKSQRGRDAYKRLRVTMDAPKDGKVTKIKEASSDAKHGWFTLSELCRELGYVGKSS